MHYAAGLGQVGRAANTIAVPAGSVPFVQGMVGEKPDYFFLSRNTNHPNVEPTPAPNPRPTGTGSSAAPRIIPIPAPKTSPILHSIILYPLTSTRSSMSGPGGLP